MTLVSNIWKMLIMMPLDLFCSNMRLPKLWKNKLLLILLIIINLFANIKLKLFLLLVKDRHSWSLLRCKILTLLIICSSTHRKLKVPLTYRCWASAKHETHIWVVDRLLGKFWRIWHLLLLLLLAVKKIMMMRWRRSGGMNHHQLLRRE